MAKKEYISPDIQIFNEQIFGMICTSPYEGGDTGKIDKGGDDVASKTFNFIGFEPDDDKK